MMKLCSINTHFIKTTNITPRRIANYVNLPLKNNLKDTVAFTGHIEHFNELTNEATGDMKVFEILYQKAEEFKKDANIRKIEAFKLLCGFNIKAEQIQDLYNNMLEDGLNMTMDEDGSEIVILPDDETPSIVATKDGEVQFIANIKDNKVINLFTFNDDGTRNEFVKQDDGFYCMAGVGEDNENGIRNEKRRYIIQGSKFIYEEGFNKVTKGDETKSTVQKHYEVTEGKLSCAYRDVEIDKKDSNNIPNRRDQAYYFYNGKLYEVRIGEKATMSDVNSCDKSCIYFNGVGELYRTRCKFNKDGSREFARVFSRPMTAFFEHVIKKPDNQCAIADTVYMYNKKDNSIQVQKDVELLLTC